MNAADPLALLNGRAKNLDRSKFAYSLEGDGGFGMDVVITAEPEVNEAEMSFVLPFADGRRRDGVGDLLEVGGIDCERHRKNPVALFDHGKQHTLPIGKCEDPKTGAYTVEIDPVSKVARAKVFVYQDADNDHAVFCEQLFDLWRKKFIRGGSIGYQVKSARELPPDYETGTPKGLHLLATLMLECSMVVMPANQDTVKGLRSVGDLANEILALPKVCGKALSPVLVKSLATYAAPRKAQVAVPLNQDLTPTDVPPAKWKPGVGAECKELDDYPVPREDAVQTKGQPSDDITPEKAEQVLKDGEVHGHPLTEKQRGMFGAAAGKEKAIGLDDAAILGLIGAGGVAVTYLLNQLMRWYHNIDEEEFWSRLHKLQDQGVISVHDGQVSKLDPPPHGKSIKALRSKYGRKQLLQQGKGLGTLARKIVANAAALGIDAATLFTASAYDPWLYERIEEFFGVPESQARDALAEIKREGFQVGQGVRFSSTARVDSDIRRTGGYIVKIDPTNRQFGRSAPYLVNFSSPQEPNNEDVDWFSHEDLQKALPAGGKKHWQVVQESDGWWVRGYGEPQDDLGPFESRNEAGAAWRDILVGKHPMLGKGQKGWNDRPEDMPWFVVKADERTLYAGPDQETAHRIAHEARRSGRYQGVTLADRGGRPMRIKGQKAAPTSGRERCYACGQMVEWRMLPNPHDGKKEPTVVDHKAPYGPGTLCQGSGNILNIHGVNATFPGRRKSLDLASVRKKYRSAKGLRRRLKKSSPGAGMVHVDAKDLEAARKFAEGRGLKFAHLASSGGLAKVKLIGDDEGIDAVAKEFGRRRFKALPGQGEKGVDVGTHVQINAGVGKAGGKTGTVIKRQGEEVLIQGDGWDGGWVNRRLVTPTGQYGHTDKALPGQGEKALLTSLLLGMLTGYGAWKLGELVAKLAIGRGYQEVEVRDAIRKLEDEGRIEIIGGKVYIKDKKHLTKSAPVTPAASEGVAARLSNAARSDNPYPPGGEDWAAWDGGWQMAGKGIKGLAANRKFINPAAEKVFKQYVYGMITRAQAMTKLCNEAGMTPQQAEAEMAETDAAMRGNKGAKGQKGVIRNAVHGVMRAVGMANKFPIGARVTITPKGRARIRSQEGRECPAEGRVTHSNDAANWHAVQWGPDSMDDWANFRGDELEVKSMSAGGQKDMRDVGGPSQLDLPREIRRNLESNGFQLNYAKPAPHGGFYLYLAPGSDLGRAAQILGRVRSRPQGDGSLWVDVQPGKSLRVDRSGGKWVVTDNQAGSFLGSFDEEDQAGAFVAKLESMDYRDRPSGSVADRSSSGGRSGTCKQGQTPKNTGCTPAPKNLNAEGRKHMARNLNGRTKALDDQEDVVEDQVKDLSNQDDWPYGLQVAHRIIEDHKQLLQDYDELNSPYLEHEHTRKALQKQLEGIAGGLDEWEAHVQKHYPDYAQHIIGDTGAKDMTEEEAGEVEGELDAMADELEGVSDEVGEEFEDTEESKDMDTMDDDGQFADSAPDEGPSPEEALEGTTKRLRNGRTKTLRVARRKSACPCGKEPCECDDKGLRRRTKDAPQTDDPEEPDMITDPLGAPDSKAEPELEEPDMVVNDSPTIGEAKDLDLDDRERGLVGEASGHAKSLAGMEQLDEEARFKSYHYHKALEGMAQIQDVNEELNGQGKGEFAGDLDWLAEEGAEGDHKGLNGRRKDAAPDDVPGVNDEDVVDLTTPTPGVADSGVGKSLHPHRQACKDASVFFGDAARTKDWGEQHRQDAQMVAKALDEITAAGPADKAPPPPEEEGFDVGEMGEKLIGGPFKDFAVGDSVKVYRPHAKLNGVPAKVTRVLPDGVYEVRLGDGRTLEVFANEVSSKALKRLKSHGWHKSADDEEDEKAKAIARKALIEQQKQVKALRQMLNGISNLTR